MKYKLTSGKIIDAEKDCNCITHSDPHWINEDKMWKDRNDLLLDHGNFYAYAKEEQLRLKYKEWFMRVHYIEEIIQDED
jgi:hypothetical protein